MELMTKQAINQRYPVDWEFEFRKIISFKARIGWQGLTSRVP